MMPYPKPGPVGGTLIRRVISFMRMQGTSLPLASDILIAISGGADSTAMAHLLVHYGRRIVPRERIRLVHINHNWRGTESEEDAESVQRLAEKWDVPIHYFKLPPIALDQEESLEEKAREQRLEIFQDLVDGTSRPTQVFTGHHADDLAETLLWRLFTGAAQVHGGGILYQHGDQIRPFLRIRKQMLEDYLLEEGQSWREDLSNQNPRFLRAKMRKTLLPTIEEIFPRAISHLVDLGLQAQSVGPKTDARLAKVLAAPKFLFEMAGVRPRRDHWKRLVQLFEEGREPVKSAESVDPKEVQLPGGWRLIQGGVRDSWTLERKPNGPVKH